MSLWQQILDLLIDPNVVFLMVSIGLIGIIVELWNPGMIFPGTVGAISLVISLFAAQVLPVNWAGLLLMLLAAAFIGAEPFVSATARSRSRGWSASCSAGCSSSSRRAACTRCRSRSSSASTGGLAGLIALVVVKLVQVRRKPVEVGTNTMVGTTASSGARARSSSTASSGGRARPTASRSGSATRSRSREWKSSS